MGAALFRVKGNRWPFWHLEISRRASGHPVQTISWLCVDDIGDISFPVLAGTCRQTVISVSCLAQVRSIIWADAPRASLPGRRWPEMRRQQISPSKVPHVAATVGSAKIGSRKIQRLMTFQDLSNAAYRQGPYQNAAWLHVPRILP